MNALNRWNHPPPRKKTITKKCFREATGYHQRSVGKRPFSERTELLQFTVWEIQCIPLATFHDSVRVFDPIPIEQTAGTVSTRDHGVVDGFIDSPASNWNSMNEIAKSGAENVCAKDMQKLSEDT